MAVNGSGVGIAARFDRARERLSSLGPRAEATFLAAACVILAGAFILPLVLPGRTLSFIYANDIMIFFDGAHRVLSGQLPNRDFHTPLGLLAYLLPALGLWLGGSLGGMMPLATAAMTLIFLPMLIYICASRLPLAHGLIFAFFALALVITPANIGETLPSFAMFYNRWGYALLAVLFLLALPPLRGKPRPWSDAILAAAVLLTTFYLKISYFGVAIGFTFVLLLYRDRRLLAIKALILAAAGIALIHLMWWGTASYFSDIATAARVNGAVRASALGLFRMAIENAAMILPFLMVMGLAFRRGIASEALVLSIFMAVAGLALFNQNFQGPGIMTLVPAAIVLAVALSWPREGKEESKTPSAFAALLLVAVLALPPAILSAE
ncbi:MAG: hypothetical protein M3N39_09730, partial [Pseudomonadota bacterium]|nr:hypothetical protein [Pseudomonadota bacterium]